MCAAESFKGGIKVIVFETSVCSDRKWQGRLWRCPAMRYGCTIWTEGRGKNKDTSVSVFTHAPVRGRPGAAGGSSITNGAVLVEVT